MQDLLRQQHCYELDSEAVRQRVQETQQKLYGGTVTNLRELEALEKELAGLKAELQHREEGLLETMMALDEGQARVRGLEGGYDDSQRLWQGRQVELAEEKGQLEANLAELEARRSDWAATLGQRELGLYESLRASRGGLAVARVERGLCRGCRMALPTHQLQQARMGKEPVQCDNCGRILYVS